MNFMKTILPQKSEKSVQTGVQDSFRKVGSKVGGEFKKLLETKRKEKQKSVLDLVLDHKEKKTQKITGKNQPEKVQTAQGKIKVLEKKLEKMKKSVDPNKRQLAVKIGKLIEKFKSLLKKQGNRLSSKKDAPVESDLSKMIHEIAGMIEEILHSQKDEKSIEKNLQILETKVGVLQKEMTRNHFLNQDIKTAMTHIGDHQKSVEVNKNKSEESKKKVTVKDLRTYKPTKGTHDIKKKTSPKLSQTKHIENHKEKVDENQKFELVRKDGEPIQKENIKQAVQSYSRSAAPTRANIETMFQTIGGRAAFTLRNGKSELRMNLNPAELGKMHLTFEVQDGVMNAKIVVSTQEARNLFEQNLPDLQRQFQAAGVDVGSMDVSFGNQGEQGAASEEQPEFGASASISSSYLEEAETREIGASAGLYDSHVNFIA